MTATEIIDGFIVLLEKLRDETKPSGEHWFRDPQGRATPRNLLNLQTLVDKSGSLNVDQLYPGLVPPNAVSLILTVERGWLDMPEGGGSVSLRVMPDGYDLSHVLDRAKDQEVISDGKAVDVVAQDVRMPISSQRRSFFWALQSTADLKAKRMVIIDLWGYVL